VTAVPEATPWLIAVPIHVRFRDCDSLGHINNAVYLTYLENARFALWKAQGVDGVILARAEVDYRSQSRFGDELEVRVRLEGFGRSSFRYEYEVADVPSQRVVVKARTVQVHFDYVKQLPVEIPEALRVRLRTPVPAVLP
jgi:acyl-CoA thioester hydrolase